jgi:hypothetical protein
MPDYFVLFYTNSADKPMMFAPFFTYAFQPNQDAFFEKGLNAEKTGPSPCIGEGPAYG